MENNLSDIGIHFIVGLSGVSLSDLDKRILETLRPAGIILLRRNFIQGTSYDIWFDQYESLIQDVQARVGRKKLIISIDHEGGSVHRTPEPFTNFSSASNYTFLSSDIAKAMACELRSIGVNIYWGPVCDINSNPENPVIGKRAFGDTPESVIVGAIPFAKTLIDEGLLPCVKHFPGHGDTSTDSHLELPALAADIDHLVKKELLPFEAAVSMGVPMVMTAHILFPNIDARYPATLSEEILKPLLRERLGFEGVVVSDDLEMKAVSFEFQNPNAIGKALSASCDMFITARHPNSNSEKPLNIAENMIKLLEEGKLSLDTVIASQKRINRMIEKELRTHHLQRLDESVFAKHNDLRNRIITPLN